MGNLVNYRPAKVMMVRMFFGGMMMKAFEMIMMIWIIMMNYPTS